MAIDTFDGAAGALPDPPWTVGLGTVSRDGAGNAVPGGTGHRNVWHDSATSTQAHRSRVTIAGLNGGDDAQLLVRASGAAGTLDCYIGYVKAGSNTFNLYRHDSGTWTARTTWTLPAAPQVGDAFELEVTADAEPAFTLRHNGVQVGSTYTDANPAPATGVGAGFGWWIGGAGAMAVAEWEGADTGGGGGGGFQPAWAARSNVLIQPGIAA